MTEKMIEIIVMEGIAGLMFVFAYAIGIKRTMHLIAGYNDRTAHYMHDKPGLARLLARLCVLLGCGSALMPLATHLWGGNATGMATWIGAYGGFIVGVTLLTVLQAREFAADPKASIKHQDK